MCFFICFHRFTSNDRDEAKRNRGSFGVKRRYNYLVEIQKSPGEFTLRGLFLCFGIRRDARHDRAGAEWKRVLLSIIEKY